MSTRVTVTYVAATFPTTLSNTTKDGKNDTGFVFVTFMRVGLTSEIAVLVDRAQLQPFACRFVNMVNFLTSTACRAST